MLRDVKLRCGCCVVENKNYVSIGNVWNEMDALPLAEERCSKYGRTAKLTLWWFFSKRRCLWLKTIEQDLIVLTNFFHFI